MYKVKPNQIALENIQQQKLLENRCVTLDENLFNIHEIISSLIPDRHIVEIPLNNYFHINTIS